jgi:acyl dehydratase
MTTAIDLASLSQRVGTAIGTSRWLDVTQQDIDAFAAATGDHQWIHVDPDRALSESPFRTTIAHGFLTLSLLSRLLHDTLTLHAVRLSINYGLNRVRFVSAVPAGSRIRAVVVLAAVARLNDSVQATWNITVEREHGERPCLVAEWLVRYYPPHGDLGSAGEAGHDNREAHETS